MTIRNHPDDLLLAAYAAGSLDEGMLLILATHLTFCLACRATVARDERIGGVLLNEVTPAPMAADALAKTLARLDETAPRPDRVASNDNTPSPLRAFLGKDLSQLRWRKMGPSLSYVTLRRRGPQALRLLRGAPGSDVGLHSHCGMEYTLVLRGGFTDASGSYGPGDFQTASPEITHNPVADPGEDCINLAVTTGRLRFNGLMQDMVSRLFGF
jgi:putative transcriptional regulator